MRLRDELMTGVMGMAMPDGLRWISSPGLAGETVCQFPGRQVGLVPVTFARAVRQEQ